MDGSKCGACNEIVPFDHTQLSRREQDGSFTSYHMGCEGLVGKLEPCKDCGNHKSFCDDCGGF